MEQGTKIIGYNAKFSNCRKYRYALWRIWDDEKPYVLFIGVNPSTADETEDDPTLRRCINYAKSWKKFGGVCMANLFACTPWDPKVPIGEENDKWLKKLAKKADIIIAAWGNDGAYRGRPQQVIDLIPNPMYCLKINKSGQPKHPLYALKDISLQEVLSQPYPPK